jgi:hypothetical protein
LSGVVMNTLLIPAQRSQRMGGLRGSQRKTRRSTTQKH